MSTYADMVLHGGRIATLDASLGVVQALAMMALLIATPFGLWAVLVCGGQSVLLFLPPSRRWFRGRPIPQAALVETS